MVLEVLFQRDQVGEGLDPDYVEGPVDGSGNSGAPYGYGHGDGYSFRLDDGGPSLTRDGGGQGDGYCYGEGDGGGDGEGLGEGNGESDRDGLYDTWATARALALERDLARLPALLSSQLHTGPEARAVALDLARTQGLRTLSEALGEPSARRS